LAMPGRFISTTVWPLNIRKLRAMPTSGNMLA
jgi:hypothetical protein